MRMLSSRFHRFTGLNINALLPRQKQGDGYVNCHGGNQQFECRAKTIDDEEIDDDRAAADACQPSHIYDTHDRTAGFVTSNLRRASNNAWPERRSADAKQNTSR